MSTENIPNSSSETNGKLGDTTEPKISKTSNQQQGASGVNVTGNVLGEFETSHIAADQHQVVGDRSTPSAVDMKGSVVDYSAHQLESRDSFDPELDKKGSPTPQIENLELKQGTDAEAEDDLPPNFRKYASEGSLSLGSSLSCSRPFYPKLETA